MTRTLTTSRKQLLYLFFILLWFTQTAAIRVADPHRQLSSEKTERVVSKRIQKKKWRFRLFKFRLFRKKKATPQAKRITQRRFQLIAGVVLVVAGLVFSMIGLAQASYCASTLQWFSSNSNCGTENTVFGWFMILLGLILLIKGIINAGKEEKTT